MPEARIALVAGIRPVFHPVRRATLDAIFASMPVTGQEALEKSGKKDCA
jgi:hypothetical protein